MIDLKKELNDKQYEAAVSIDGPQLIIAGAGSGKTRMITFKTAFMIENAGIAPKHILALTFTNKAAAEMKERIQTLIGERAKKLTVSTFHSFGLSLIRRYGAELGYSGRFSVYDADDAQSAAKEAAVELKIPLESVNLTETAALFSAVKTGRTPLPAAYKEWYEFYNRRLKAFNAVDFDDLLALPLKLLRENATVCEECRSRYRYILVDEFQDTSTIQYEIVKTLAEKHRNLSVVGDDDQSIYSWRGADFGNFLRFERDFPERREIKLEQNYRSTKNILEAANRLISRNLNRKTKNLWTGGESGRHIELFTPEDEEAEAAFIASTIRSLRFNHKLKYDDFAVLVRTNTLCAPIEAELLNNNIPYTVSGGTSFFQRKEIKDVIAYMKTVVNPDDEINLLRILNTPRRGLGVKSIERLKQFADARKFSLYTALCTIAASADREAFFPKAVGDEIEEFVGLIETYRQRFDEPGSRASVVLSSLLEEIFYYAFVINETKNNERLAKFKLGNIARFIDMIRRWESDPERENRSLPDFLNRITLLTDDRKDGDGEDKVNLMTIHASKGLEFNVVFLAGVEEEIIPHKRSIEENAENIEEERRLFYVALTRAKRHIVITSCAKRKRNRIAVTANPSPFLAEIPEELTVRHDPSKKTENFDPKTLLANLKKTLSTS